MKRRKAALVWVAALVWLAGPADAASLDTVIDCPPDATVGSTVTIDVTLLNRECRDLGARDVRLVTGISGNADDTLEGVGVFGPVVALQQVSVPAATDNLPGTCDTMNYTCDGSGGTVFCFQDSDCECRDVTPGTLSLPVTALPAAPGVLADTVATWFVLAEWEGGEEVDVETCNVAVPEPTVHLQLLAGVTALLALARRRAGRRIVWDRS